MKKKKLPVVHATTSLLEFGHISFQIYACVWFLYNYNHRCTIDLYTALFT